MDYLPILERSVAIPTWRSPDNPEVEAAASAYFSDVIARELPWLHVTHEAVTRNRFNVFATDGAPVEVLFVAHLDTVPPGTNWRYRITGERVGDRFYGRGALDVKGGIVSLLAALAQGGPTRGVGVLLYCDEEYDFHGMRRFLAIERGCARPKLLIAIEATGLKLRFGCRGVGEFTPVVRGRCGHAARPWTGVSAYAAFASGLRSLDAYLDENASATFGSATCNLAALHVGQSVGRTAERELLAEDGNIIPDYARGVVEVRMLPEMDIDACIAAFDRGVRSGGGELESADKRFDFRGFATPPDRLVAFSAIVERIFGRVEVEPIGKSGYSDVSILCTQLGAPCVIFGPSGGNLHSADEYVELASLAQLQRVFEEVLAPYRAASQSVAPAAIAARATEGDV